MHKLVFTRKTVNNNTHPYSNISSSTPITNKVIAYYHKTTPIKARIQDAINFLDKKGIKGLNEDVFWSNSVCHATGYKILKSSNSRTLKNNPTRKKIRGWKKVITADQIREIEKILQNKGLEDHTLIGTAESGGRSRSFRLDN